MYFNLTLLHVNGSDREVQVIRSISIVRNFLQEIIVYDTGIIVIFSFREFFLDDNAWKSEKKPKNKNSAKDISFQSLSID